MARILFAWQLGGGSGHLMRMLPLAKGLADRGHLVFMAVKHLARAAVHYRRLPFQLLQAPERRGNRAVFPRAVTIAHVLANTGFANQADLCGVASA